MYSLKFSFGKEKRRALVPAPKESETLSFEMVANMARELFKIKDDVMFQWTDDEKEPISCSTDAELAVAITVMSAENPKQIYNFVVVALSDQLPNVVDAGVASMPAASSSSSSAPAPSPQSKVVHTDVTCINCGMSPIIGVRYTCTQRHDYNLCGRCQLVNFSGIPVLMLGGQYRADASSSSSSSSSSYASSGYGEICDGSGGDYSIVHGMGELMLGKPAKIFNNTSNGISTVDYILPRLGLVSKLAQYLHAGNQFIIISSPAGTGKTSVVHLLKYHLLKARTIGDFIFRGVQFSGSAVSATEKLGQIGLSFNACTCEWVVAPKLREQRILLFLDDSHCQYQDIDFWANLMKETSPLPSNIQVIIVATFVLEGNRSPVEFKSVTARIGRADMLLSEHESSDYIRHCVPDCLSSFAGFLKTIVSECGGTVAALRKVGEFFHQYCVHNALPSLDITVALELYFSRELLNVMFRLFGTKLPDCSNGTMRTMMIDLLRNKSADCENEEIVGQLIEAGIVAFNEDKKKITFASGLAHRFYLNKFYSFRAVENPPSLLRLVTLAIGSLSSSLLAQSVVPNSSDFPKEATFQHLFLTSLAAHTTADTSICPELSRRYPSVLLSNRADTINGEIDFYLNGSLRWGIELLISGRNVTEHIDRFGRAGKYHPLQLKDYIVVDFRMCPETGISHVHPHSNRLSVFFNSSFEECSCLYGTDPNPFKVKLQL